MPLTFPSIEQLANSRLYCTKHFKWMTFRIVTKIDHSPRTGLRWECDAGGGSPLRPLHVHVPRQLLQVQLRQWLQYGGRDQHLLQWEQMERNQARVSRLVKAVIHYLECIMMSAWRSPSSPRVVCWLWRGGRTQRVCWLWSDWAWTNYPVRYNI